MTTNTAPTRYGMTIPFMGVPLHEQRDWIVELADLGYTDVWSAEADGADGFTPAGPGVGLGAVAAPRHGHHPGVHPGPGAAGPDRSPALADAAPGRFAFGIGTSSNVIVERWNGIPFEEPYRAVRDMVRFLRAAFTGEKVTGTLRDAHEVNGFRLGIQPEVEPSDPDRRPA